MEEVMQQDGGIVGVKQLIASGGSFRLHYGSRQLIVKSEEASTAQIDIFSAEGRLVGQTAVAVAGGKATVSVAHLPAGFYTARATDDRGNRVSCKFMTGR